MDDAFDNEEQQTDLFIVMWCKEGLECIINVTEIEEENTMRRLGDESPRSIGSILHALTLRARFNGQRCYEIYSVRASKGITEADLTSYFNSDPQSAVDTIRERGMKIYSDRSTSSVIQ